MSDGKISLTSTIAWATWCLSGLLVIACLVVSRDPASTDGMVLCTGAIILAAAASTIHIRSFMCKQQERIRWAYQLGRDRGKQEMLEEEVSVPLQRVH